MSYYLQWLKRVLTRKSIIIFILFSASLIFAFYYLIKEKTHTYDLIIKEVNIIDAVNHQIKPNKTILVNSDTIVAILDDFPQGNISDNTKIIDGNGKYISSGFWNMHTHVCWKPNLNKKLFPILLSYGITGLRDMGGRLDILNQFKEDSKQNPSSLPTLFGAGPIIDGPNPIHKDFSVAATNKNIDKVLDSLYKNKVDFLKVYSLLPKTTLETIAKFSNEKNIPFAGHISEFTEPIEAVRLGQKSIEHFNGMDYLIKETDSTSLKSFTNALLKNKTWMCPTLVIYKRKIDIIEKKDLFKPLYDDLDVDLKSEWQYALNNSSKSKDNLSQLKEDYNAYKKLVKWFYKNDVNLLIGTDFAGMPFVYPGLGLHEEMQLFSDIGIDNNDILKMATYNPAVYFGKHKTHGTIEEGKKADFVLFNENPVDNINNTRSIFSVVKNGKQLVE